MYISECKIRVRYAETDKMGVVYYGNYALYFEVARTEAMRKLGLPYDDLEKQGIIMPVVKMESRYKAAAKYDDLLHIETIISEMPNRSMRFEYRIYNQLEEFLHEASTTLLFVEEESGKLRSAPDKLKESLKAYF